MPENENTKEFIVDDIGIFTRVCRYEPGGNYAFAYEQMIPKEAFIAAYRRYIVEGSEQNEE